MSFIDLNIHTSLSLVEFDIGTKMSFSILDTQMGTSFPRTRILAFPPPKETQMVAFSDIFMINDFQIILWINFPEVPKDLSENVACNKRKSTESMTATLVTLGIDWALL